MPGLLRLLYLLQLKLVLVLGYQVGLQLLIYLLEVTFLINSMVILLFFGFGHTVLDVTDQLTQTRLV